MIRLTFFLCLGVLLVLFNLISCETPHQGVYSLAPMDNLYKGDTPSKGDDEFVFKTTLDIIEKFEYNSETLEVVTGDKYTIRAFRIIKRKDQIVDRPVVLLMHGAWGSSSDYVFAGEESALGFYLVEEGFDVWLGNFRGNVFSGLEHEKGKFWDFSFHEMGNYDIPAFIDSILEKTKQKKLFLIAFSMGTTASYVMLSLRPEYNEKINKMITMAPMVFTDSSKTTVSNKIQLGLFNLLSFLGKTFNAKLYIKNSVKGMRTPKCYKISWERTCKESMDELSANSSYKPLYDGKLRYEFLKITPAGGSWKTIYHFAQMDKTGVFAPYNYREDKRNRKKSKAGTKDPPPYDLSKVTVPILLLIAKSDKFVNPKNIEKLKNKLSRAHVTEIYVNEPEFKHTDFFVAKGLKTLVFPNVKEFLTVNP